MIEVIGKRGTTFFLFVSAITLFLGGCIGVKTFPNTVRAGETVSIAAGWQHNFSRDNITVTINPSSGSPIVYAPNDSAVRAAINFYPDPVSRLVVSEDLDIDIDYGGTYADQVNFLFTDDDNDWWLTVVIVDLPTTLPIGTTTIAITNPQGDSVSNTVEIVDSGGSPSDFQYRFGPLSGAQITSMERMPHFVVTLDGPTVPYAIQLDLAHTLAAKTFRLVDPRGSMKNLQWSATTNTITAILAPSDSQAVRDMKDFKFYIAGSDFDATGITGNVQIQGVQAFDVNGNTVTGVTATITRMEINL